MRRKVVVVGGGPAGMLAAGRAAECGARVVLLERNSVLGRKLRITGKGRGNVTNMADLREFVAAFGHGGKFLYGALTRFSNLDLIEFLNRLGVSTKVEKGKRVYPVSDRAEDVAGALERWLDKLGVEVRTGCRVREIVVEEGAVKGVRVFSGMVAADALVLATGGITYPRTGSTGDGYRMAEEVGHTVVKPEPSLTSLETEEKWVARVSDLTLRNVSAVLYAGGKCVGKEFGELEFTEFGVTGPIVLRLSRLYSKLEDKSEIELFINLKPALTREQIESRLIRDLGKAKRPLGKYLEELLPRRLIGVFLELCGLQASHATNSITVEQRRRMVDVLMGVRLGIRGARPADEAIVTAGGVSLKEIDSRTMESKIVRRLYFAGEVIDVDAVTGGYNLQAAFSTGWVAGESASTEAWC